MACLPAISDRDLFTFTCASEALSADIRAAGLQKADIVISAFVGDYPKGLDYGASAGVREGREDFLYYGAMHRPNISAALQKICRPAN